MVVNFQMIQHEGLEDTKSDMPQAGRINDGTDRDGRKDS